MFRFLKSLLVTSALLTVALTHANAETLHLSHVLTADDPLNQAALRFADAVREKTQGRVDIKVHSDGSLAGLKDGVEGVSLGTVDISLPDSGTIGNWVSQIGILNLPFVFSDWDHAKRVYDTSVQKWFSDPIRKNVNAVLLSAAPVGFRVIMTTKKPVNSASDMSGIKLRVPEIPVLVQAFTAVKANASPIPWGESYTALQTGVVEGIEGSPVALNGLRAYEVTKYATHTNHILLDALMIMNAQKFDALSPDDQRVVQTAAKEIMGDWLYQTRRAAEEKAWGEIAKRVQANDNADIESFRKAMQPVVEKFVEKNKIQAIYGELRSLDQK